MARLFTPYITRRTVLAGLAALSATSQTARGAADMLGVGSTRFNRFPLGAFEVTTLLAGTGTIEDPHMTFGVNVSDEDFAAASQAAHIPADVWQNFYTPTVVNTGKMLVLFDTGLDPDGITAALVDAGYEPEMIDIVVLTHMHGDHIGGLMREVEPTFPNARYVTGNIEFDSWDDTGDGGFKTKVLPLVEKLSFIAEGQDVVTGITAIEAFGHTAGHTIYHIESEGEQLLLAADFANHYVWSLANPDWENHFDEDKAQAAKTRRMVLELLAANRMPFVGYHMPWPGLGYVEAREDGYLYVPATYQMML